MTERYDETAAAHYAAYRPPLHKIILARVLAGERFTVGLDVGCGTGYSAVALADHCHHVIAADRSHSMLSRTAPHAQVSYVCAACESMPLTTGSVDVVTFAGSFFYADGDATRREMIRVCHAGTVVIYDFEVLLDELLRCLGLHRAADRSRYDHAANLSSAPGFTELAAGRDRVSVRVTGSELAHVVLSDSHRCDHIVRRYRAADPLPPLVGELTACEQHSIEADIYYSKYRIDAS